MSETVVLMMEATTLGDCRSAELWQRSHFKSLTTLSQSFGMCESPDYTQLIMDEEFMINSEKGVETAEGGTIRL